MQRFRVGTLRLLLTLTWLIGAGTLVAESMLPDMHGPHTHADEAPGGVIAGTDGDSTPTPHTSTDTCHCVHAHLGGVAEACASFAVRAALLEPPSFAAVRRPSLATAPPHQPPRA